MHQEKAMSFSAINSWLSNKRKLDESDSSNSDSDSDSNGDSNSNSSSSSSSKRSPTDSSESDDSPRKPKHNAAPKFAPLPRRRSLRLIIKSVRETNVNNIEPRAPPEALSDPDYYCLLPELTPPSSPETEVETVVAGPIGSKEVEILEVKGELKDRGVPHSEISTEDEWEKVSENENEKDK